MYKRKTMRRHRRASKRTRRTKRTKRRATRKMRGGNRLLPNAFGAPYNAVDLKPNGNYYPFNTKVEQWPIQSNTQVGAMLGGGRRRTKYNKNKQSGGGITEFITTLLPEEVVNVGRSIPAGIGHMYDKFNGTISTPSSLVYPTQQPAVASTTMRGYNQANGNVADGVTPSDITGIYNRVNNQLTGL